MNDGEYYSKQGRCILVQHALLWLIAEQRAANTREHVEILQESTSCLIKLDMHSANGKQQWSPTCRECCFGAQ